MINTKRILKENISINLNIYKEELSGCEENYGFTFQSHILVIQTSEFNDSVDIDALNKELYSEIYSIKISNKEVLLGFAHTASDVLYSIEEIYKEIEAEVDHINSSLDKFRIKDYKLICEFGTIEY